MSHYGFIITRHVRSEQTNKYWNQCVKLIRYFYPLRQIVIIDDNSNQEFVKPDRDYMNVTVVQSEFPGRGELLPYYYLLKHRWFPNAVILHDSLFIHKHISFEKFNVPVLPLWHHPYDKENLPNILRIASVLTNKQEIMKLLNEKEEVISSLSFVNNKFNLCFGCQCYIKLSFLDSLQHKYRITNLVHVVHNRPDRCSLERVLGAIFCKEFHKLLQLGSMFGDIQAYPNSFGYTFDNYMDDIKHKRRLKTFTKVWTGR